MSRQLNLKKFFFLGTGFLIIGFIAYYALPPVISKFIDLQIALTPGSKSYPLWKDLPVPIYQKFYFFNVTNAQDIEQFGAKPRLEEIGPFTYRSDWTKREIVTDEKLKTIKFKHYKQWHFEPDMSIADQNLHLVTLNAPLAITLTLIQSASSAVRILVTFSLDGLSDGFFTERSVKQLLFDGYPDLLTTFGPLLNAEMLSQGGQFGYMNARNDSLDGEYEINSGSGDISKLNTIRRFNGRTSLPFWHHHSHCNSLDGATTGEMFPPIRDNHTSLKLFQPDLCRVWRLNYDSQLDGPSGLKLNRYVASRDVFRNSTDLSENSCFFKAPRSQASHDHSPMATNRIPDPSRQSAGTSRPARPARPHESNRVSAGNANNARHQNRVRHEWPNGVFTLAPCKFNAPIFVSMPHFLDADPHFRAHVDGLEPRRDRHEFYVDVEPRTGSPIDLAARVQLNVAISKPPGLIRFRHIPEIMFPVFWQELSVNLTSKPVIEQLELAAKGAQEANIMIAYSFFILGSAVLITTILFHVHCNNITK